LTADGASAEVTTFPRVNIEYVNIIGKAWFGKVIEAEATNIAVGSDKLRVITKVLKDDATDEERKLFLNESKLYRLSTNHESILKLVGCAIEKMPYILMMENFPIGDLKGYLLTKASNEEFISNEILMLMIKGIV